MEELDPLCLARDQEVHGIHIHQHHLVEVEGHLTSVSMHFGFDLGDVLRADATDEVVHRVSVIARCFDPERHGLASQSGRPQGKPRA